MLERAHRFLTTRGRPEIEPVADRYFRALGYRRRADDAERLVFERGDRFASYYASSLRRCATRVEVLPEAPPELRDGETKPGTLLLRHRVETAGRVVLDQDEALLDAEARGFERFLERGDLDVVALLEAARKAKRGGAFWRLAIALVLICGAVAGLAARVALQARG